MDISGIRNAAIEISTIADLYKQESEEGIKNNADLRSKRKSLLFMKERIVNLTFQISKELKALEKKENL